MRPRLDAFGADVGRLVRWHLNGVGVKTRCPPGRVAGVESGDVDRARTVQLFEFGLLNVVGSPSRRGSALRGDARWSDDLQAERRCELREARDVRRLVAGDGISVLRPAARGPV